MQIYDSKGALIHNLVYGILKAGVFKVTVDGTELSSGVYCYKFITDNFTETKFYPYNFIDL